MTIRSLPKGVPLPVRVRSLAGREAVVEMDGDGEPGMDQAVELSDETAVYLGVVAQVETQAGSRTLWLELEHYMDRQQLAEVQATWGEHKEKSLKD